MKYSFIETNRSKLGVQRMCKAFAVSRSGYYAWRNRGKSKRQFDNECLVKAIEHIHQSSRGTYGSPRITVELKKRGLICSKNKVAKLMQNNQLQGVQRRKRRSTTFSRHDFKVARNILGQMTVKMPNEAWGSDITNISTKEGWLYLCVVLDLCSRRVVGWSMRDDLKAELPINALEMAHANRRPPPGPGVIFHSDRGIQYACRTFRTVLKKFGMIQSMSRKANCWDNACAESFFGTLKLELVDRMFKTRQEAKTLIFEYIEAFYNRTRIHSSLNYLSPEEFESTFVA